MAEPAPDAEKAVRSWLGAGAPAAAEITDDDGRAQADLVDVRATEVTALFSAGRRVAFHAVVHGRYAGGLPDLDAAPGAPVSMGLAGLVDVAADGSTAGHVVRDRLGVHRALSR